MKKIIMFIFVYLLIPLFKPSLVRADRFWDKVALEKVVNKKVKRALGSFLSQEEYVVETKITIDDPTPPNFSDGKRKKVKISVISMDDSKGDYIAFSKVGLEVPVVDEYLKKDDIKSYFEKLYTLKQSIEIEELISDINIIIIVDKSIDDVRLGQVKPIITALAIRINDISPRVAIKKENLKGKANDKIALKTTPKKEVKKDWFYFFKEFATPIGFILSTILLGLFARNLLKKWGSIISQLNESKKPDVSPMQNNKDDSDKNDKNKEESLIPQKSTSDSVNDEVLVQKGMERFRYCFTNSSSIILNLIKKWIYEESEDSRLILSYVAYALDTEVLTNLFHLIEDEYRKKWKDSIVADLSLEDLKNADRLLGEAIVSELVVKEQIDNSGLLDLIIGLSAEEAISFIKNNQDKASHLIFLLSNTQLTNVINTSKDFDFSSCLNEAMELSVDQIDQEKLRGELVKYCTNSELNPFVTKMKTILVHVDFDKEDMVLKSLFQKTPRNVISAMVKDIIPFAILKSLEESLLFRLMENYSIEKKVKLAVVMENEDRENFLNGFAKKGSKAREVIDLELKPLLENELGIKRIKKDSDTIWEDYITHARSYFNENLDAKDSLGPQIENYLDSFEVRDEEVNDVS